MICLEWSAVEPTRGTAMTACRLVNRYPLSAADGLQLAAAMSVASDHPEALDFVCLDQRLRDAAEREGFLLLPVTI